MAEVLYAMLAIRTAPVAKMVVHFTCPIEIARIQIRDLISVTMEVDVVVRMGPVLDHLCETGSVATDAIWTILKIRWVVVVRYLAEQVHRRLILREVRQMITLIEAVPIIIEVRILTDLEILILILSRIKRLTDLADRVVQLRPRLLCIAIFIGVRQGLSCKPVLACRWDRVKHKDSTVLTIIILIII